MAALDVWRVTPGAVAGHAYRVLYEDQLPACCERTAHDAGDRFECLSCGAQWTREEQPKTLVLEGEARLEQYEHDDPEAGMPYQLVVNDWEIAHWIEDEVWSRGSWGRYPHTPQGTKLPRLKITIELLEDE